MTGPAKWVGGGFGLGNAIVGAAQAVAMNLASGAVHGAVNLVGKDISSMDAAMSESAMFSRAETRERLANTLYLDVFDLVYVMERTIKTANIAIRPITPTDERKAGSLFENLKTLNLDYAQAYDVAFQIFQTNPSEYEYYEYCMKRFSYQQPNLIQIGEYCQADLSKITESIFEQIFSQMPHETEEETLRLHEKLIEKKNELGVSRSVTIDEVAKMLRDFDVAARTFHNETYNTRELRAKAEADDHQLAAICTKIGE